MQSEAIRMQKQASFFSVIDSIYKEGYAFRVIDNQIFSALGVPRTRMYGTQWGKLVQVQHCPATVFY
jgi:hypothetical protein